MRRRSFRYLLRGSSTRSSKGKLFVDLEWKEFDADLEEVAVADPKAIAAKQVATYVKDFAASPPSIAAAEGEH